MGKKGVAQGRKEEQRMNKKSQKQTAKERAREREHSERKDVKKRITGEEELGDVQPTSNRL